MARAGRHSITGLSNEAHVIIDVPKSPEVVIVGSKYEDDPEGKGELEPKDEDIKPKGELDVEIIDMGSDLENDYDDDLITILLRITRCPRCHIQGTWKVSHSSQKPRVKYIKCLLCDKFLKRINDDNEMEKRIMIMLTKFKKELSELKMIFKLMEKGLSIVYMLLIGVIVVLTTVMVV
ncbi:hypothetical protein Cgig2_025006 [Carnegiea gigantea]|uniref:Uncharacterized protein n=1 Tax=Carnegiea gigantea TaxID=171969 RepID=A0A9Q1GMC0_9CARY|nr:hypothetical protein Cgig2_025006 [Carnegiea gigantea]